jgi:hypothetical protein
MAGTRPAMTVSERVGYPAMTVLERAGRTKKSFPFLAKIRAWRKSGLHAA